jgi:tungstate transport system ATP-binding protein
MGLILPSAGTVTWGGRESVAPVRRAIVFQHPVMLRRTAAENLRYALKVSGRLPRKMYDSRIAELLSLVGLSEFGDRPARTMSGGEKRRLALARALAGDPAVLSAAAKVAEDVIGTVTARNIKVVMSTHDLGSARRLAGDIIFMQRGRVAETGAASTFFNEPHSDEAKIFITGNLLV